MSSTFGTKGGNESDIRMEGEVVGAAERARDLLTSGLRPGIPRTNGGLTLIPLFGGAPASTPYLIAREASDAGLLAIEELNGGSVPHVKARNRGSAPILILEGEHLEGAKQNRVLTATTLIAAGKETVLPVVCVEQHRWHYAARPDFAPSEHFAYVTLRGLNRSAAVALARAGSRERGDQHSVWRDVEARAATFGTSAPTGAMSDVYEGTRILVEEVRTGLGEPAPLQTGVVACVGGRSIAVDVFDRPETLGKLWRRLTWGYAMEALGAPPAPVEEDAAGRMLAAGALAEMTSHPAFGLGTDVMITGAGFVGGALLWQGAVVHLALFASDGWAERSTSRQSSAFEGPITRRARLRRSR